MSRFNEKKRTEPTYNKAGGKAFKISPKLELVNLLLTSFVKDKFYKTGVDELIGLEELIAKIDDKKFIAKAAIFARNVFGMRTITHVVGGELSKYVKGESWTKNFYSKLVFRVDDITEILSYVIGKFGKPIPNSLKKGLALAFGKFDRYQLAKYKAENKAVSLVDAVNLVRPKPTDKNRSALKDLVEGNLKEENTWEARLSNAGRVAKNAEEKKQLKEAGLTDLYKEQRMGYTANLRNLNNVLSMAPNLKQAARKLLLNEKLLKQSKILPFRFLRALEEVHDSELKGAISQAMEMSLANCPVFPGETLVVLDESGSMSGRGWYTGKIESESPAYIGGIFAAVMVKTNKCDFMTFANNARYASMNVADSVLTMAKGIDFVWGGTNFNSIFNTANKLYDRIIILSDMQGWVDNFGLKDAYRGYCKEYNCKPKLYTWDLTGSSTSMFPEDNVYCISGFSEKAFDMMEMLEQDRNALVKRIEAVEL